MLEIISSDILFIESNKVTPFTLSMLIPRAKDGLILGLVDDEGLTLELTDLDIDADGLTDGLRDLDILELTDLDIDLDIDADGLTLGLIDLDIDLDIDGLILRLIDGLIDLDIDGDILGDMEADGSPENVT